MNRGKLSINDPEGARDAFITALVETGIPNDSGFEGIDNAALKLFRGLYKEFHARRMLGLWQKLRETALTPAESKDLGTAMIAVALVHDGLDSMHVVNLIGKDKSR